jgi:hypothetical protein
LSAPPTSAVDGGLHADDFLELDTDCVGKEMSVDNNGAVDMDVQPEFHAAAATPTFSLSIGAFDLEKVSSN